MFSVLQNDEVRQEISKEISAVAMSAITDFIKQNAQNYEDADKTIQSWESAMPGYIDDFLSTPEVQDFIGNVASDYAMAALSDNDPQNISVSSKLNDLISENGDMFDEKFDKIFTDQNLSKEAAREKIAAFAAEKDITVSENYDSYSDVILEIVKASEAKIDNSAKDIFGNIVPTANTAQADAVSSRLFYKTSNLSYPMLAVQFSILGLDMDFNEDQTTFEIFSQILTILQSPVMYVLIAALLALFFLLIAIFSLSFKKPFLFTGISVAITGVLLIVISKYPIPFDLILNQIPTENPAYNSAIAEAIPGIWSSVSSILLIHAIIATIISALCFLFFIFTKKQKNKKTG